MKKRWIAIVLTVIILLLLGLLGCNSTGSGSETITITNQQEGISVSGQGRVAVVPDLAILNVGVQAQETTVAMAQAATADAMDKVMAALTGNGVANNDIQTQSFSIQVVSRYDPGNQQEIVTGYRVTNIVTAKIRTLDRIGVIIDAAASAGGDLARIQGISFTVEDPTTYLSQAREKAVADAKAKADQIAALVGVTVGEPTYISESTSSPVYRDTVAVPAAPETSISPGEVEVSASVQVIYSIAD